MERAVIVESFDSILLEKDSNEYTNNIVDKNNTDFEYNNLDLKTLEKNISIKFITKIIEILQKPVKF